jgi:hypothetical protein
MNSANSDPTLALSYLEGASDSVRDMGTQTVGGVATTHYHAIVSIDRLIARMTARAPAGQRAAVRSSYERLRTMIGSSTYPMDVWLDSAGRVRQLRYAMRMPSLGASMAITMGLSDFGVPVRVTPPPASRTTDYLAFLKAGARPATGVTPAP